MLQVNNKQSLCEASSAKSPCWRMETVTCKNSGVQYCLWVHGSDSAKLRFVMLHGFPDFGKAWMWYLLPYMIQSFGADFQMIAPDLRGVGCTHTPRLDDEYQSTFYLPDNMIKDLKDIWEHYGFTEKKRPWVIAHDWGANLGWDLYFYSSKMMEGYVAMSIPPMYVNQLREMDPQLQAISTYDKSWKMNPTFWQNVWTYELFGKKATAPTSFSKAFFNESDINNKTHVEDAYRQFTSPHNETLGWHLLWYQYFFDNHSSPDGSDPRMHCDPADKDGGICKPFVEYKPSNKSTWPKAGYIAGGLDFWLSPKHMACCSTRKLPNLRFEYLNDTGHFIPHENPKKVAEFIYNMVYHYGGLESLNDFCQCHKADFWSATSQSFCPEKVDDVKHDDVNVLERCNETCGEAISALKTCFLTSNATNGECVADYCKHIPEYELCLRNEDNAWCYNMTNLSAAATKGKGDIVLTLNYFLNLTVCAPFNTSEIRQLGYDGLPK
eukprot:TRINITY_DN40433_c0_g1_i1.p1 TRINITY_DN40433_c0_g1~~TRINITY_DN40433_c0_g1_i1.p1  ORF type:complete len:543 (-),score=60.46 TRINITY_DN40433_c0_g1_i1:116-1597(-)